MLIRIGRSCGKIATVICHEIPGADVLFFGSRARGEARTDSDVDLLITVSDQWLATHDRWSVLDRLRWHISEPGGPVDLSLFSRSEVEQRCKLRSHVVYQAYKEGARVDGSS